MDSNSGVELALIGKVGAEVRGAGAGSPLHDESRLPRRGKKEMATIQPDRQLGTDHTDHTDYSEGSTSVRTVPALDRESLRLYGPPAAALIGLFLPWATVSAPIIGNISITGDQTDGFLLVLGLAAAVAGFAYLGRTRDRLLAAGGLAVVSLYALWYINDILSQMKAELAGNIFAAAVNVSLGIGLYILVAGALAATYFGYRDYKAEQAEPSAPAGGVVGADD